MKLLSPSPATTRRRQWLGFMLSPVVWTTYFVLVYVLDEAACKLTLIGEEALLPLATLFGLLTLGVIGYAARLAYQAWRYGDEAGNGRFLGMSGLLLCGLFALMTAATWAAAWLLTPC